jgi:hypothetical protein
MTPITATTPTLALPPMPNLHVDNHMVDTPQEPHSAHNHLIFIQTHAISSIRSSNQMGCFPITYNRGNVMLLSSTSLMQTTSIQSPSRTVQKKNYYAPTAKTTKLTLRGFKPLLHKLDNETSHKVEQFVSSQQTHLQYTSPDNHCTNPRITSLQALQASPSPSPSQTGVN